MYRLRFHGRGGQGIKTASRILGSAFFDEGYEVQDAPYYGAERRGAPIFATVRASRSPIFERGVIARPDLVVVADHTLVGVPSAGALHGIDEHTVLLLEGEDEAIQWRDRLGLRGPVSMLGGQGTDATEQRFLGAICAGAAARLVGVISRESLERAIFGELASMGEEVAGRSASRAMAAYDRFADQAGCVAEGPEAEPTGPEPPVWTELPLEPARIAAPDIYAAGTSIQVKTGLWRLMRPVIDHEHCRRCSWVCGTLCPDRAIEVDAEGWPQVDYDHCKGCLVCVAVCPSHAIRAVPERDAEASPAEVAP